MPTLAEEGETASAESQLLAKSWMSGQCTEHRLAYQMETPQRDFRIFYLSKI